VKRGRWPGRAAHALRLTPTLLRRAVANAWRHRILGLSAEAAFWQLLSLPSLVLALVATLGYVSKWLGPKTVDTAERDIERTLGRAFSQQVVTEVIHPTLREVLHSGRADIISVGFFLAIWAGSSATATFVNTITIAYDMRDLRGAVRSRLLALWLFLGSVLIGVAVLPMLVLGPSLIKRAVPARTRHTFATLIDAGYYPVVIILLMIGLATLYHLAPPRRLPWRRGVPGAVLGMLVFLAGSAALRTYISFVIDHNSAAYSTIAAPIATLLFFFVLALGVLLGAEFNAAIEAYSPAKARTPRVLNPKVWRRLDETAFDSGLSDSGVSDSGVSEPEASQPAASEAAPPPAADRPAERAPRRAARPSAGQAVVNLLARRTHR
jgi:membrane protein